MQKHIQHNKDERTQFFRKIYHSLYLKGFERITKGIICERWVGYRTELQLNAPQLFWLQQHFFPVFLGCLTGDMGAQPQLGHGSHSSIISPTDLSFLSPGLYNNLTHTYFLRASQFALNSTLWQSTLSSDIFVRVHLLFTQVHFFFWQLGRGQYVTCVWQYIRSPTQAKEFSAVARIMQSSSNEFSTLVADKV